MKSEEERILRDRIFQYLRISGLRHEEASGAIYVGPLVIFIGPKGAEVLFRNFSQRHRVSSEPPPIHPIDNKGRRDWVEVVKPTLNPEEVVSYVDNLLNPSGVKTLVYKGARYQRTAR